MKAKILALLKTEYPEYVSGEEISRMLGISRTAVWKHIRSLRENGYVVESHPRIGYRLVATPDRLYQHELESLLNTRIIGKRIVHRETVGSTNELAKELAQKGAVDGTVVIAEEQTEGKGRMGRVWHSPAGRGLWFSVILRPPISPADASKLTLVTAVAAARTIREMTGIAAGIKWPNDILIDDHKVAGILTEMSAELDKVNHLIIGIGINVDLNPASIPAGIAGIATSLAHEKGSPVTRIELLAGILNRFDELYTDFLQGRFTRILTAWKDLSITLNRWVTVRSLTGTEEGVAFDVDDEGALLLKKKDGSMKRVLSGEVSLR